MTDITIPCPQCGRRVLEDDKNLPQTLMCPHCDHTFACPAELRPQGSGRRRITRKRFISLLMSVVLLGIVVGNWRTVASYAQHWLDVVRPNRLVHRSTSITPWGETLVATVYFETFKNEPLRAPVFTARLKPDSQVRILRFWHAGGGIHTGPKIENLEEDARSATLKMSPRGAMGVTLSIHVSGPSRVYISEPKLLVKQYAVDVAFPDDYRVRNIDERR